MLDIRDELIVCIRMRMLDSFIINKESCLLGLTILKRTRILLLVCVKIWSKKGKGEKFEGSELFVVPGTWDCTHD